MNMESNDSVKMFNQECLRIVVDGNSIIAELLKLAQQIPEPFVPNTPESIKFKDILHDFSLMKDVNPNQSIDVTKGQSNLEDLYNELQENYNETLSEYYELFRDIITYMNKFNSLLTKVKNNGFVQCKFDNITYDLEARQLTSEAIYLYGLMLYLLEKNLPDKIRQKIILAYYKFNGESAINSIENVFKLCQSVKTNDPKLPYPLEIFERFKLSQPEYLLKLVDRLKDDEIYNNSRIYQESSYRTIALSNQASILVIILLFLPKTLMDEIEVMKFITTRFFSDNWEICIFQGYRENLFDFWGSFKAARTALKHSLTVEVIKEKANQNFYILDKLMEELNKNLVDGVLQLEYVLDNNDSLMSLLKKINAALRWVLLHKNSNLFKQKDIFNIMIKDDSVLKLILKTSEFEEMYKEILEKICNSKKEYFEKDQNQVLEYLLESSEYFAGNRQYSKVDKNENYEKIFKDFAAKIKDCNVKHSSPASDSIWRSHEGLNQLEQIPQVANNAQLSYFIKETKSKLKHMIKILSIRRSLISNLSIFSDFSYAWIVIEDYIPQMHKLIKQDKNAVLLLRSVFLKLASILNSPLLRAYQLGSEATELSKQISQFYSRELVRFVDKVLSVIPTSIFELVIKLKKSLNPSIVMEEAKVLRSELGDHAKIEERFLIAQYCHKISIFAQGMLSMDKCLMGIIEVDPYEFLVNGIKNELAKFLCNQFNCSIRIKKTGNLADLLKLMKDLSFDTYYLKLSLECVQDFIGIHALKIFGEQLGRIIEFNVEREFNIKELQRKKIKNESFSNLNDLPIYEPFDNNNTFMGRLLYYIINLLDKTPNAYYLTRAGGWYDDKGNLIMGLRTFATLVTALDIAGVKGLDLILCYNITKELKSIWAKYSKNCEPNSEFKIALIAATQIISDISLTQSSFNNMQNYILKCKNLLDYLFSEFVIIGRLIALRLLILNYLEMHAKIESKGLFSALNSLNMGTSNELRAKLSEIMLNKKDNNTLKNQTVEFSTRLGKYLEYAGISNPISKIYCLCKSDVSFLGVAAGLSIVRTIKMGFYDAKLGLFVKKETKESLKIELALLGLQSIFSHLHPSYYSMFIATISEIAGQIMNSRIASKTKESLYSQFQMDFILKEIEFLRPDIKYNFCWKVMKPIHDIPIIE